MYIGYLDCVFVILKYIKFSGNRWIFIIIDCWYYMEKINSYGLIIYFFMVIKMIIYVVNLFFEIVLKFGFCDF